MEETLLTNRIYLIYFSCNVEIYIYRERERDRETEREREFLVGCNITPQYFLIGCKF